MPETAFVLLSGGTFPGDFCDGIQKPYFLRTGAAQLPQVRQYGICMGLGGPSGKFLTPGAAFGAVCNELDGVMC